MSERSGICRKNKEEIMEVQLRNQSYGILLNHPESIGLRLKLSLKRIFLHPLYRHAFSTISKLKKENRSLICDSLFWRWEEKKSPNYRQRWWNAFGPVHYAHLLRQRNIENDISQAAQEKNMNWFRSGFKELRGLGSPVELGKIAKS